MARKFFLIIPSFLFSLLLYAQSPVDDEAAGALIKGTEKVARKMLSAAFTPFTDYSQGDILAGGALGYTRIDRVWTDPEVTGENLTGISLGGGAGYALTDRLALYAMGDLLLVDGRMESSFFTAPGGTVGGRLNFVMGNLFAGAGYDFVKRGPFSLPLFLGLHCSGYSLNGDLDSKSVTVPVSGTAEAELTALGLTPGFSGGLAGEVRIGRMSLSGYGLFMADFIGLSGRSETTVTPSLPGVPVTYSMNHETSAYAGGTYGFALKIATREGWTVGLDFSDFLPFGEGGEEGTQMSTLALTVGYRS